MREHIQHTSIACPTEVALKIIGGKWKLVILEHLLTGVRRFGELQRATSTITARMLTRQLRELEADGLVLRTVYPQARTVRPAASVSWVISSTTVPSAVLPWLRQLTLSPG